MRRIENVIRSGASSGISSPVCSSCSAPWCSGPLHEYYHPCAESATEESLLEYYRHIKSTQPSLPHRAGKAYAEFVRRIMAGRAIHNAGPTRA